MTSEHPQWSKVRVRECFQHGRRERFQSKATFAFLIWAKP